MNMALQIYLCVVAFAALAVLVDISKSLLKIAAKLVLRESNYAKGYEHGCRDTKRHYGIEDGDT
jgi:hypothetical protein